MQESVGASEPLEGLRERKKRARREALIDATHTLVEQHGLDHVTVEAICGLAGVSTRTFFNYFETKDDAVLGHRPWPSTSPTAETFAAGGPTGDLFADLLDVVREVLHEPTVGPERLARVIELAHREPRLFARHVSWIEQHKGRLTELVERRLGEHPVHPPEVVASLALFLAHTTFLHWDANQRSGTADENLAEVVASLRAILAPGPDTTP